jgi:nitrous oxide reductase accessory protein NosL
MSAVRRLALPLAAAAMLTGWGCEDAAGPAPPAIRFGEDVCVRCGMIISDDRYAAGASVSVDDRHEPRAFDDVGCLLAFRDEDGPAIAAEYVADFRTRQWLGVPDAVYVHSSALHSPMAFGVAACGNRGDAEALLQSYGGELLDANALRSRYERGALRIDPSTARKEGGG